MADFSRSTRRKFGWQLSLFFLVASAATQAAEKSTDWGSMIERISSGVVSLKVDVPRSFDTEQNETSQATGFVVDAKLGLILTNRHVVTPGPVRAEALFLNQEEVPLIPVYRDPVHDFGLFRYDPSALRYIQPIELQLAPERAAVGLDVRIVGNDAGEQLSILSGTIARLDRRAPTYGYGNYNDFNTFYIQAATGSSGGSSGSPVLDRHGVVVALNAGASSTASSSFFLPLDRVKRAVELLRNGKAVTRGTLQTQFVQLAFDELRRLGLANQTETDYREKFPDLTGMLVVSNVIRGSNADSKLRVGDVLLALNGQALVDFVAIEAVLDDRVGSTVLLTVERQGKGLDIELPVDDLHAISPDEYLEFGEAVVHDLSYQQAWHLNRPLSGVYVADAGYVLGAADIPAQSVIEELDGQPVANLDAFEDALANLADGQEVAVRFYTLEDPRNSAQELLRMDRKWFPAMRCSRDDIQGGWPCRPLVNGPPPAAPKLSTASYIDQKDRGLDRVSRSLVLVNFDMPYTLSGVAEQHYYGTGLVVDAERGLVVADRNTVPEAVGDVRLTFAGSVSINGRVEFIHPLHNLALLSYDPAQLGDTEVLSARLQPGEQHAGATLRAVGLRSDSKLVSQEVQVASIDPVGFPLSRTMRFRDTNLEAISLVTPPRGIDGVLVDKRARVVALWSSFAYDSGNDVYQENLGVPVGIVSEMLEALARDDGVAKIEAKSDPVFLRSLEVELLQMPLSTARNFGLPDEWAQRLELHDPSRRQVLAINRVVAGTESAKLFATGDLLLAIDGLPVNRFRAVERAVQKPSATVTVWRNNAELSFAVTTTPLSGRGVRRLLRWGGALLQESYREMAAQRGIDPTGVYVAFFSYGSPASRAGLSAGSRIVEVDGVPVADIDEFIMQVKDRQDRDSVRLTTRSWNDTVRVLTLKLDQAFWPAWEVVYSDGWQRRELVER